MSAGDTLRASDSRALNNNQIISHVSGKKTGKKKKNKLVSISAAAFIVAMVVILGVFFGLGNAIPDGISERLIEETDVQYADAVASKIAVFAEAMKEGDVPDNTASRLKSYGVLVGQNTGDGFREINKADSELVLKYNNEIINADNFRNKVMSDTGLYDAFNKATYSRAAYYYDSSATDVFRKIGSSRNNYTSDASFDEVMNSVVGEGSDIDVNNVALFEWEDEETGEIIQEYDEVGETGNSDSEATAFIESVRSKNYAGSSEEATMNTADALATADTISKEQKSSLFFLAFMENISKMKAGDGSNSKINDAMNYLFDNKESSVVDINTGETITTYGSMTESPSLYAVLSGEKMEVDKVKNYSSQRVLSAVENRVGIDGASDDTLTGTITSTNTGIRGTIGRFLEFFGVEASWDGLDVVTPIIQDSLVNNSYDTYQGIKGGEFLVEGAVNVGKELAKAGGATAGDANSVRSYAGLTNQVLAMEAKVDRMNRSPFDITSRNTFLGSIMFKFAIQMRGNSAVNKMASFTNVMSSSVASLLPTTMADDKADSYLSNFGECEKMNRIGAEGSATCSMIATYDTSTYDAFNDPAFQAFMDENTSIDENGVRTINGNSKLADFIKYNTERITPIGVTDGGILDSLINGDGGNRIPFLSDIISMIKISLEATDEDKRVASGEVFINSSSNPDWETYKYAQRYIAYARATESLRQYDGEATAYSSLKYLEGTENPVIAFIREYREIANK